MKIDRVLDRAEIKARGGNPDASFYVAFMPGAMAGSFKGSNAPLVSAPAYKGTHGYLPDEPSMRSAFMLMGEGIPKGKSLGVIDMRMIAPTLAVLMRAGLSGADLPPLDVEARP
jgi:hypothetical protein